MHGAWFVRLALFLALVSGLTACAHGGKGDKAVDVTVIVTDTESHPIPTAVVRHPAEADRHRVNAVDGTFTASILYLPDGSELRFLPGEVLELEISAPGYVTRVIQYDVRKRNNKVPVQLETLELENEIIEEPVMQFGRDKPREGVGGTPAN